MEHLTKKKYKKKKKKEKIQRVWYWKTPPLAFRSGAGGISLMMMILLLFCSRPFGHELTTLPSQSLRIASSFQESILYHL